MHKWTIYACHCVDSFTFKRKSAFGFKMNWIPIKSVRLLNWRAKLFGGGKPSPSLILDNRGTQNFWRENSVSYRLIKAGYHISPYFVTRSSPIHWQFMDFSFFMNIIYLCLVGRESRSSMACDVTWLKIGTAKAAHEVLSQNDDKATNWGE